MVEQEEESEEVNINNNLVLIATNQPHSQYLHCDHVQVAQNRQNGRTVSGLRPESHPKGLEGSEGGKHRFKNF